MNIKKLSLLLAASVFSISSAAAFAMGTSNDNLDKAVNDKLNSDSTTANVMTSNDVKVKTSKDGVVTVTGKVQNMSQKTAIEDNIKSVSGVKKVDTKGLKVIGGSTGGKMGTKGSSVAPSGGTSDGTSGTSNSY